MPRRRAPLDSRDRVLGALGRVFRPRGGLRGPWRARMLDAVVAASRRRERPPGTPPRAATATRTPLSASTLRMTQNYENMVATVNAARDDVEKAMAHNKAACARVRKSMQEIKNLAQEIRKEMLELRDAGN